MTRRRRTIVRLLLTAGAFFLIGRTGRRLLAHEGQDPPSRREFALTARNYAFAPNRIEVIHDDLVTITLTSEDQTHSFTIDEYRIVRRIPAAGSAMLEFRADRPGTFAFYCNISTDPGCRQMRGELVVRPK